jgi:hypothetical protein
MKSSPTRRFTLGALTVLNVGLLAAFYLGLLAFASWASRLVRWEEVVFLAALPMAILGVVLSLRSPRLVFPAAVNGFLALILAGLWALFLVPSR